jgi:hypothetical protein
MIIKKRIKIPLYFQNLYIIQTDDFETIHREYKLKGSVDFAGVTILDDDEIVVVFRTDVTPSIIAHEALHVCSYVFQGIDAEYDRDNDETLAYLLGWVVEQIHKTIKVNGK